MQTILTKKIDQKSAWKGQDIKQKNDWIYHLSDHTLAILDQGLHHLQAHSLTAPHFQKSDFQITDAVVLKEFLQLAEELENGYGFLVLRGLDAKKYNETELATLYYLIGLHLGTPVTQNERGHLIGYVQNVGDLSKKSTRVYETNAYLPYHTDMSDVVGLLSIRKAKTGGLSSLVSTAAVYNAILEQYPEYLAYYYHPAYYDHLGEKEPSLSPIFSFWKNKLACRYLRYYIELGHERKNIPLSRVQIDALNIYDQISQDPNLRLDMMLEPGDIQFCNNYCVMHSRSAFEDVEDIHQRRKLLRLWLKMDNARELAPDFPGRNGIPASLEFEEAI